MDTKKRKISIIGSTGSIGTQALEVIEKLQDKFEIIALAGGNNVELLKQQVLKFKPKYVSVGRDKNTQNIQIEGTKTLYGNEGLEEICSNKENDIILVAVSGKVGLKPTLKAIENGIDIALANKRNPCYGRRYCNEKSKKNMVLISFLLIVSIVQFISV